MSVLPWRQPGLEEGLRLETREGSERGRAKREGGKMCHLRFQAPSLFLMIRHEGGQGGPITSRFQTGPKNVAPLIARLRKFQDKDLDMNVK